MNNWKKILFAVNLLVVCAAAVPNLCLAQKTGLRAIAGPKGIWVILGEQLPKNFSYQVSRQKNNGEWVKVDTVTMPKNKDEIQATIVNNETAAGIDIIPLTDVRLQAVWERVSDNIITNSPPEMQDDLPLRSATGTAWYDAAADSAVVYRYKVSIIDRKGESPGVESNIIKYPVVKFVTDIRPLSVKPTRDGIYAEFLIEDKGVMTRCKILRSYYLRSGFEEISTKPLFMQRGKKMVITFTDNSAVEKVPYTYAVLPLDAAGNKGYASPELKAFDVPDKSIVPSVHGFRTYSVEAKRAIRLGWKLGNTDVVNTIDIYKSDSFNGKYYKLATVAPTDTSYFDREVKPITTYFYAIKLMGKYESSPLSPRIPGVLRATDKNLFPPQGITLKQDSDKVTLSWQKNEDDTRAYYIYRADDNGPMRQISSAIVTDSLNVSYVDKLPLSGSPVVYKYAVADENTSYAISPKSAPLYAYTHGGTTLPIPYNVAVRRLKANTLQIIWPDMSSQRQQFAGYMLYRRVKTGGKSGKPELLNSKPIPGRTNFYIDSTVTEGASYYYSVKTVGFDGKKLSSPSLEAGYTIDADIVANVSNIKVIPADNKVALSWNNPMGQATQAILIFRAEEGKEPQQLASLTADKQSYTDTSVVKDVIYYYTFSVKDQKGKNSNTSDPVGIHL